MGQEVAEKRVKKPLSILTELKKEGKMKKEKEKDELFNENENKDVVKKKTTDIAKPIKTAMAPGTEAIGDNILLPRLKILHSLSTEIREHIEGAVPGKIKNNMTDEMWDKLQVIPIKMFITRTLFDPDNRDGAPLCRSVNGHSSNSGEFCDTCEHGEKLWKEGKPPDCRLIFNYLCIQPEDIGKTGMFPMILSLMGTSTQAARKMNTPSRISNLPFWCWVWELSSKERKFKKGPAFILIPKQVRETTAEERKCAEAMYQAMATKTIETEDIEKDDFTEEDFNFEEEK